MPFDHPAIDDLVADEEHEGPGGEAEGDAGATAGRERLFDELVGNRADQHAGAEGHDQPEEPVADADAQDEQPADEKRGGREQAPAEGCAHSAAVAHDAAEAEVTRRGLDHLGLPRRRPVAEAVVRGARCEPPLITRRGTARRAQMRSATGRFDLLCGRGRRGRTSIPDVPGHVVEAVAVRREAPDGRCALVPVHLQVLPGNSPCHVLAMACPPGKCSSPQANTAPETAAGRPRHSASVGSSLPAHPAYACTSS